MLRLLRFAAKVLIVICFPLAALAAAFLKKTRNCTPQEFAAELQKFADGNEGPRDWDFLETVPIQNAKLEAIRREAIMFAPPTESEDLPRVRTKMSALAVQARMISEVD
jgi:hypothetical protein